VKAAATDLRDVLIVDTAGRLHVDEEMMDEAARIKAAVKPDQILFVVDAMTGQSAVETARAFAEKVDFDGVVVTKLDGDARGGAALSVKAVTGKPIMFVGTSEKIEGFEPFRPDRMAQRILGMGDVLTLIERVQETADMEQAEEMAARLRADDFTLDDFLAQIEQVKKLGSLEQIMSMMPGAAQLKDVEVDPKAIDRTQAIIRSMTAKERAKPQIISGQRRERIARGSGVTVTEVNQLLKQFAEARKMVKKMVAAQKQGKGKGRGKRRFGGMPGMGGGSGNPFGF
jgi:signal recognition particle subunit SRP54